MWCKMLPFLTNLNRSIVFGPCDAKLYFILLNYHHIFHLHFQTLKGDRSELAQSVKLDTSIF